ncbi:unnamed protein product [Peniophora sp. CBMAI 1063]|nr:unnamed protein product [Peniophora sp. CBMAI 1063]
MSDRSSSPMDTIDDWEELTCEGLARRGFKPAPRVSIHAKDLQAHIADYPISGIPLVIEGLHEHRAFVKKMFNADWYMKHGQQELEVRDVDARTDRKISTADFIKRCRALSNGDTGLQTLYAKDAQCPDEWYQWATQRGAIPSDLAPSGTDDAFQYMPQEIRPETIMCYLGTGGTYTPCHKDLCASSGQNLMVFTEDDGSSFWLMTKSSDAYQVATYFRRELKQLIDWENHTITLDELQKAPFDVYYVQQRLGDFVLVPPRSCHQVVNQGGLSIKLAWSRMTVKGLETALFHEVPLYRRVCRKETYCVKSMIWHAVRVATERVEAEPTDRKKQQSSSAGDLPKLAELLRAVLVEEFHPEQDGFTKFADDESQADSFSCDYCQCDIFVSFFECRACPGNASSTENGAVSDEDVHMCPGCVAEGRSCACARPMTPVQRFPYSQVREGYNRAVRALRTATEGDEWRELTPSEEPCTAVNREIGLFKGAVALTRQARGRQPKETIRCYGNYARTEQHIVKRSHAISCKGCHFALCYEHWATVGIHSSEIALVRQLDTKDGKLWHSRHRMLKQAWEGERRTVAEADAEGAALPPPLVSGRLAEFCIEFPYSRPNPGVRIGFYDLE